MPKKIWLYGNNFGVFLADGKAISKDRFLEMGGDLLPYTKHHNTDPFAIPHVSQSGWAR